MNQYGGITLAETLQAVDMLSKLMNQYYDKNEIIYNIKSNSSLSWFQKRRLIKQMKL